MDGIIGRKFEWQFKYRNESNVKAQSRHGQKHPVLLDQTKALTRVDHGV